MLELAELAAAIDQVIERATGKVFVVDLHTTSADGFPFAVVGATDEHRRFAHSFPLSGIIGLEDHLDGVLTRYLAGLGCITLAIEGGQSATDARRGKTSKPAWTVALAASGVVPEIHGRGRRPAEHLATARGDLPHTVEVVARHAVRPEGVLPHGAGLREHSSHAGGHAARARTAAARSAPFDGVVLLPLYQPQGEDGFFYGRAVD